MFFEDWMGRTKPELRRKRVTEKDKQIRDKLINGDEDECRALIEQGILEVQNTWSERERRMRSGRPPSEPHVEIQETGEGQYSQNRKPAIGRPKT